MNTTDKSDEFRFANGQSVTDRLLSLTKNSNKQFASSILPGVPNVLGLRIPDLRKLASEIAHGDWQNYLASPGTFYMEHRLLHALVLGKIPVKHTHCYLQLIENFIADINSWAVCDAFTFSGRQRFVDDNYTEVLSLLMRHINSNNEYAVRFAVVMLMRYFISSNNIKWFINTMESVSHQGYYVRMAVAWAVAEAYIRYPNQVTPLLVTSTLPDWTLNKTLSKINDSLRISKYDKKHLRQIVKKQH